MNVTQATVDLIKHFEGCRLRAYRCPAGVWTIGYGRTRGVRSGDVISQLQADAWLRQDIADVAARIRPLIDVDLSNNQFGAIVSFAFNCGVSTYARSSVRQRVNARRFGEVPGRLMLWVRGGGKVLPGLVRRRRAEGALWSRR